MTRHLTAPEWARLKDAMAAWHASQERAAAALDADRKILRGVFVDLGLDPDATYRGDETTCTLTRCEPSSAPS